MMNNFKKLLSTFIVILLSCIVVSCSKKEAPKPQNPPVKVQKLELEPVAVSTDYVGVLNTKLSTNIYPRVSGPINKIYVDDGSYVKKGQPILSIEHSEQSAATASSVASANSMKEQVSSAYAQLESSKADLEAAKSAMKLAKIEFDRYKTLYESGSATKADFDTYTNQYEQAKSQLKSAEESYNQSKIQITSRKQTYKGYVDQANQQKSVLDYYTIKAPFNGRIGVVIPSMGQYVTSQDLITVLEGSETLDIEVGIDAKYKKKIKKGLTINILDRDNNPVRNGKIWFIAPKVDPSTQTILVKATIENDDKKFDDDQIVKVSVVWETTQGITIPTPSIVSFSGQKYVYIVDEEKGQKIAKQVPVQFGHLLGQKVEVTEGLKEGDILITSGVQKLRNQTPIQILKNEDKDGNTVKKSKEKES